MYTSSWYGLCVLKDILFGIAVIVTSPYPPLNIMEAYTHGIQPCVFILNIHIQRVHAFLTNVEIPFLKYNINGMFLMLFL